MVLSVCVSQGWYTVSTSVSPDLTFTGADFDASLSSSLILVGLMTLVAVYLKSKMGAALHGVSLILVVTVAAISGARIAAVDLTSVEAKIERATGVAGWLSQKSEVVIQVDLSPWPLVALLPALALAMALALLALAAFRGNMQTAKNPQGIKPKEPVNASDLWSETSEHL